MAEHPRTGPAAQTISSGAGASAQRLRALAWVCASTLILLGAAVLVGWAIDNQPMKTVLPGRASMKPNTALSFLLLGVTLAVGLYRDSRARGYRPLLERGLALLSGLPGALTLAEYLFHVDLHIDQMLFRDVVQLRFPGRAALISCIGFVMMAAAFYCRSGGRRARRLSQALALFVLAIAGACIVGYLYGVPTLYGDVGQHGYISMALHTGIAFLVVAVGVLAAERESRLALLLSSPQSGSWLIRRLLPFIVVVPVGLGWIYLRPALDFGGPRFGMALLTVSLVATGVAALLVLGEFLNRQQSERERNAAALAESAAAMETSERELRLLTDQLPTLISYLSPQGRFLRVNRTYEQWSGLPARQIIGCTIQELLGERYWVSTQAARERVLCGEPVSFEASYPTASGERMAQVTYVPDFGDSMDDPSGSRQVRGFACMVVDVDEHRKAEAALRQSEKLAAVGRLASSIAHEINNPLEAVTNLLYLAEQDLTEESPAGSAGERPAAEYVRLAQSELGRVTHIVVQTLRFHRQSTGATLCKVTDLLEQVLGLYGGRLAGAEIAVERCFDAVPALRCREGEIRQVLANLVGNAADAMPHGGRLLLRTRLLKDVRTGRPAVVVTVADTGSGIAPEIRARLFQPFHTTKGAKGSGLGLWVSKEIVDRHEGSMHARTSAGTVEGGHGTVFRLVLPLDGAAPAAGEQPVA